MTQSSLVSPASVKEWLNTSNAQFPSNSDNLIERLVGMASQFATSYLQRPIAPATVAEVYNGQDTRQLPLRQKPVILVRSLTIGTVVIPARTQVGGYGFVNDTESVYVDGGFWGRPFCRGIQNIAVTYDAGYQTSDATTVPTAPAAQEIDVTDLSQPWNSDRGVAYASGSAFTLVNVAPTVAGTYQLTEDSQDNTEYNFAPAEAGASIVITYGYTPQDLAQALIAFVGEQYMARERIGQNSKSLGNGQVVSFSQKDMAAPLRTLLNPYRNVTPV